MRVLWSKYARHSFAEEIDFILIKWNSKEVAKFILLVETSIEKLSSSTWQGKISKKTNIRSLVI